MNMTELPNSAGIRVSRGNDAIAALEPKSGLQIWKNEPKFYNRFNVDYWKTRQRRQYAL